MFLYDIIVPTNKEELMLIFAAAANGPEELDLISDLFSQSSYIQFYDADSFVLLSSEARNERSDVELAQLIADKNAEALLCGPLNQDAFDIIASDENSITRYNAVGMICIDALNAAMNYKLDVIRDPIDGIGCIGHHLHE